MVDFIFVSSPSLRKFVESGEFDFAKMNSAQIYTFLNTYLVKIYSFKITQKSY